MTKLTGKSPGVGKQSLWAAELITNLLQKEKSINPVATVTFG